MPVRGSCKLGGSDSPQSESWKKAMHRGGIYEQTTTLPCKAKAVSAYFTSKHILHFGIAEPPHLTGSPRGYPVVFFPLSCFCEWTFRIQFWLGIRDGLNFWTRVVNQLVHTRYIDWRLIQWVNILCLLRWPSENPNWNSTSSVPPDQGRGIGAVVKAACLENRKSRVRTPLQLLNFKEIKCSFPSHS